MAGDQISNLWAALLVLATHCDEWQGRPRYALGFHAPHKAYVTGQYANLSSAWEDDVVTYPDQGSENGDRVDKVVEDLERIAV